MPTELYANDAAGIVTAGGQTQTDTSWTVTVTSPGSFPAASSSAGTQFHVADPANPTELITVTNVTGGPSYAWTVVRGDEGTAAVVHSSNFVVRQVVSAGDLTALQVKPVLQAQTLSSSGAVTIQAGTGIAEITLNASATSCAVSGLQTGQQLTISWIQGGAGGYAYAWPSSCQFAGGSIPPNITAPGQADTATFIYDGTHLVQTGAGSANSWAGKQLYSSGSPWFGVDAFGADPAGVSDSTVAFNKCIAACLGGSYYTGLTYTASSTAVGNLSAQASDLNKYINSSNFTAGYAQITALTGSPGAYTGYTVSGPGTVSTGIVSPQNAFIGYAQISGPKTPLGSMVMGAGTYKITSDLIIRSTSGFRLAGQGPDATTIRASGTAFTTAVLLVDGAMDGVFEGFSITGDGTEQVTDAMRLDWTPAAGRSTTGNRFRDIRIRNINFVVGFSLEGTAGAQVDGTTIDNIVIQGGFRAGGWTNSARTDTASWASPGSIITDSSATSADILKNISGPGIPALTYITNVVGSSVTLSQGVTGSASGVSISVGSGNWQKGYAFGQGTYANNYDHVLLNGNAGGCYYGWHCNASGFELFGAQPSQNAVDFYVVPGVQTIIQGVQSQSSGQFLVGGGTSPVAVAIRDVEYLSSFLASSGRWISIGSGACSWLFENVEASTVGSASAPVMFFSSSGASQTGVITTAAASAVGGEVSQIANATWTSTTFGGLSPGVLTVASVAGFPSSGTLSVAASGPTTAVVTYTGIATGQFTGCAYSSGSATGTIQASGQVNMTQAGEVITLINVKQANSPAAGIVSGYGGPVIAINYTQFTAATHTPDITYPFYAINANVLFRQSAFAGQPAASAYGEGFFWAADTNALYYSNGSAWTPITMAPTVGGTFTSPVAVTGISGAASASRWVGAVSGAAPATASPAAGDFAPDQAGAAWVYSGTSWNRIAGTRRVVTVTGSGGTYTPNADTTDIAVISTPASGSFTIGAPATVTGLADGQSLLIRFSSGSAVVAPSWTTTSGGYLAGTQLALPTGFTPSATDVLGFQYDTALGMWIFLAYSPGYP